MSLKTTEVCSKEDCHLPYYAKWLCKKHYKMMLGREGAYKREYEKRSQISTYKEKKNLSDKLYREKLKAQGVLSKRQAIYYRNWISKKANYLKKKEWAKRDNDKHNFGGLREQILKRDNYSCIKCKISQKEHFKKYGFDLNIHHIDGNGWNKPKDQKNNTLENLQTLCHSCHLHKHN